MNIREKADEIVGAMQEERWQAQRARIEAALSEAYRLGFLDGEASVKPSETRHDFSAPVEPLEWDDADGVCV